MPVICEACGVTFNLPDEFLTSLGNIACGECDTKGRFQKAAVGIDSPNGESGE